MTNPVPLHVLHRIMPELPLHAAVHSNGLLRAGPGRCRPRGRVVRDLHRGFSPPVPSRCTGPLCAHAGHGSGSPFRPRATAKPPMITPKPAMEASCAARGPRRTEAPRRARRVRADRLRGSPRIGAGRGRGRRRAFRARVGEARAPGVARTGGDAVDGHARFTASRRAGVARALIVARRVSRPRRDARRRRVARDLPLTSAPDRRAHSPARALHPSGTPPRARSARRSSAIEMAAAAALARSARPPAGPPSVSRRRPRRRSTSIAGRAVRRRNRARRRDARACPPSASPVAR